MNRAKAGLTKKKVKEKIESVYNGSKKDYEKINDINAILINEKDNAMNRMNDIQNDLKGLRNNLKQKRLERNIAYFSFSFFQIFGLLLVSLKSILK